MTNVYVVTSGSYSDYGIRAVFSTRKLAQDYIDKANSIREADGVDYSTANVYFAADANIETWGLNLEVEAKAFSFWTVGMLLDDGSVIEPVHEGLEYGRPVSRVVQCGVKVPCYNNRPIVRVFSVKSAKHAQKMAVEARQAWLRKKTEHIGKDGE